MALVAPLPQAEDRRPYTESRTARTHPVHRRMSVLVPISNDLRRQAGVQRVALRACRFPRIIKPGLAEWGSYEKMERGLIPDDALSAGVGIGIPCYYLPDPKFIDPNGLTDATTARNPVTRPNHERIMAHDRRAPAGYLEERGVNLYVGEPATSEHRALRSADFAVKAGPGLWMPEVARIRTGQLVSGGPRLWHGELEVGGRETP